MNATRASEPQDRRDGAVFRGRLLQALEDGAAELRVEAGGADVELAAAGGLTGLVPEEDADDRLPGLGALLRGRSPDALGERLDGREVADVGEEPAPFQRI